MRARLPHLLPWRLFALAAPLVLASCGHYVLYDQPAGPRYQGAFAAHPDPDTLVRVVTFNIQYARHIDRAIAVLTEDPHLRDADLVCLQEMDAPGTEQVAKALGLHWLYFPAVWHPKAGHDFGNAILSRWPIRDGRKVILPHRARFVHSQRIAVTGIVDIGDTPVRVYSVHLALPVTVSGGGRRDQIHAVLTDARSGPEHVIFAGDMNSHGIGKEAAKAGWAWPTEHIGSTAGHFDIDQLFLRGLRLAGPDSIGVVRDNRKASDHHPVWAVLAFAPITPEGATDR
jgi:endonuclease/exonuclease/phosphatase family metal-dependent hydrolase